MKQLQQLLMGLNMEAFRIVCSQILNLDCNVFKQKHTKWKGGEESTILNVAQVVMFQANLPIKYCGVYLSSNTLNYSNSNKYLSGKSPYEILLKNANIQSLKVFEYWCYIQCI